MKYWTFGLASRIDNRDFPLQLVRKAPQDSTVLHRHKFTELVIIYEGEGDLYNNGGMPVHISRGNVFVVPQEKVFHRYDNLNNLHLVNIIFEKNRLPLPLLDVFTIPGFNVLFNDQLDQDVARSNIYSVSEEQLLQLLKYVNELELFLKEQTSGYQFISMSLFMQIVYFLSKVIEHNFNATVSNRLSISQAIGFLHSHFNRNDLSIEEIAEIANMSMSTLLRHFRRQVGCSPKEYLSKLRIQHACGMLINTDLDISEIAMLCGFEDSNYFSRKFKNITKLSPSRFREKSIHSFSLPENDKNSEKKKNTGIRNRKN